MAEETYDAADEAILTNETTADEPGSRISRWLRDPRLARAGLGLAGVSAIASLIGEWQIIEMRMQQENGEVNQLLLSSLTNLGAFGTSYIMLVSLIFAATALALFGQLNARPPARTAGLALSGVAAGILVASWYTLTKIPSAPAFSGFNGPGLFDDMTFGPARGLYAAMLTVLVLATVLWLSEQTRALPRRAAEPADPSKEVIDLTVTAAPPFLH